MKHAIVLFLAISLISLQAAAQKSTSQYPGKIKYMKVEQDATVFDVPYPADQVEDGLKDMFEKKGMKVKEKNGFYSAPNVKLDESGSKMGDVYYKVVKDGRNESKLYVIVTEPGEAPESRSSSHAAIVASAGLGVGAVLGDIAPALDENNFSIIKSKQEDEIKKAEKKLNGMVEDQERLENRRAELEKDIEKLRRDQINLQTELRAKKAGLAEFIEKAGKGKKD